MNRHELHIRLRHCQGAVLRAIGLMERRGFRLATCEVTEAEGGEQTLRARVTSDRAPELLKRQLERLHDVLQVELEPTVPTGAGKPAAMRPIEGS